MRTTNPTVAALQEIMTQIREDAKAYAALVKENEKLTKLVERLNAKLENSGATRTRCVRVEEDEQSKRRRRTRKPVEAEVEQPKRRRVRNANMEEKPAKKAVVKKGFSLL